MDNLIEDYEKRISACNLLQAYIIKSNPTLLRDLKLSNIDMDNYMYILYLGLRQLRQDLLNDRWANDKS